MDSHISSYVNSVTSILEDLEATQLSIPLSLYDALKEGKTYILRIKHRNGQMTIPLMIGAEKIVDNKHQIPELRGYFVILGTERLHVFVEENVRGFTYLTKKQHLSAAWAYPPSTYLRVVLKKGSFTHEKSGEDELKPQDVKLMLAYMEQQVLQLHQNEIEETDRDNVFLKRFYGVGRIIKRAWNTGNRKSFYQRLLAILNRSEAFQTLGRLSHLDTLSHLRRVMTVVNNSPGLARAIKKRYIHASQRGLFCPAETPEGPSIGFVKQLALGVEISTNTTDYKPPVNMVSLPKDPQDHTFFNNNSPVFHNGKMVGILPQQNSTTYYWTDVGQLSNKSTSIIGIAASQMPFLNHNPSPRVSYQCSHAKQAMDTGTKLNHRYRFDKVLHLLNQAQRPLIETKHELVCNGANLVVAVMPYEGWNQEDALILNQSAIDRGLLKSTHYFTFTELLGSQASLFSSNSNIISHHRIPFNGIISVGTIVNTGDCIICRITSEDKLLYTRIPEHIIEAEVIQVFTNKQIVRVKVVCQRTPAVGDKLSSRHAQKGVIGKLLRQHELPFTKEGIVPDLIISPHAFPSRMTVGQLIESVLGRSGAELGTFMSSTPFAKIPLQELQDKAIKMKELMYSGRTGKPIRHPIAIGIVYYRRLRHMAIDKIQSRGNGKTHQLTGQPVSGKSNNNGGGMRIGEMERDALLAHGAAHLLHERLVRSSDQGKAFELLTKELKGIGIMTR
tara:strand:- start:519 stop:2702 length:2184 start_codon:yes stop_codon:yes gene_type:complete